MPTALLLWQKDKGRWPVFAFPDLNDRLKKLAWLDGQSDRHRPSGDGAGYFLHVLEPKTLLYGLNMARRLMW